MSNIIELTNATVDDLHKIITSNSKVIVDFWATWCGPCKLLSPIIDLVAAVSPDVIFVKVNIDTNIPLTESYSIRTVPYILYYVDGTLKGQHLGAISEAGLSKFIS